LVDVELNIGLGILAFSKQKTIQFKPIEVESTYLLITNKPDKLSEAGLQ
jgi:hypothetical protein